MSFLEDLYTKRQKLASLLSDPEYSGIREIVEELYPDRAHFIFELLQNAEDAGATEVTFTLRQNCLTFEHNGRKFNEADVSAITNIGKGTKRDQEDKIGRFGVGFKAVFAYTETPHIWSPSFSFKICQLVLPIEIAADANLGEKTRFEFPFNNPKKKEKAAYAEIEAGLSDLEYTALLFLRNIQSIRWHIAPRVSGQLLRIEHSKSHIDISKQVGMRTSNAHFLRFSESVPGLERQQAAIAFDLDFQPNASTFDPQKRLSKQFRIVPANPGRVAVFFPAEKETSGLRFHLHAPFITELSRASIKETPANEPLFELLAKISASALHKIREADLLNVGLLSVLPNPQDSLPARYQPMREAIVAEMNNRPLTPTYSKTHAPAKHLLQAKASLKELLSTEDLKFLIPHEKELLHWTITAPQRNSDADRFLNGLAITSWDVAEFIDLLSDKLMTGQRYIGQPPWYANGPDKKFITWLSGKSLDWHQQLYALLWNEALSRQQEYLRKKLFDKLKNLRIVRLSDGTYSLGRKCYFPSEDIQHDKILPRVSAGVYSSGKSKTQQSDAKKLLEEVGVVEVGERQQVEAILKQRYTSEADVPDDATYLSDLKRFISLVDSEANISSLFADYYIFRQKDGTWATPSQMYLDSPFIDTGLTAFHDALGEVATRGALHGDYAQIKLPVKKFLKFVEDVGVQTSLRIERVSCDGNAAASYLKWQAAGRWSSTGLDEDYTITGLDDALKEGNEGLSRLIWNTACQQKNTDWLVAKYRNNQQHVIRDAPSQLAYMLRHRAWIPQSGGKFVRPTSASRQLLPDGFAFDPGYGWLKAIHFGEDEQVQSEEHQQQQSLAQKLGFADTETLERAKQFAAIPRETQERILAEFLREQTDLPQNEPKNPERRADRVASQAGEAPERITEERLRSVAIGREQVKEKAAQYLQQQYTNSDGEMICQICRSVLPFKLGDGTYYFETIEFLKELEKRHYQNYLSLCPNHAAMFMHANDSAESMKQVFIEIEGNEIGLVLAQKDYNIYFTKTHVGDLKTVIEADRSRQHSQRDVVDDRVGNSAAVRENFLTQDVVSHAVNVKDTLVTLNDVHLSNNERSRPTARVSAKNLHQNKEANAVVTSQRHLVTAILPERNIRITFKSGDKTIWQSRVYKSKNTIEKIIAFARTQARAAGVPIQQDVRAVGEITNDGRVFTVIHEDSENGVQAPQGAGNRHDGLWVRNVMQMCLEHRQVTRYVYERVFKAGALLRSQFSNRRECQIALRLALLGYLECSDYSKDVTERLFKISAHKPEGNVLNL